MAVQVLSTLLSGSGNVVDPGSGDDALVTATGAAVSSDGNAILINDADQKLTVLGVAYGDTNGIAAEVGSDASLVIGATGQVTGGTNGVRIAADSFGDASASSLINNGEIVGISDDGLDVKGSDFSLLNNGSITGRFGLYYSSPNSTGVNIVNNGLMGSSGGVNFAIYLGIAIGGRIVNTGTINGDVAIVGTGGFIVQNSGTITGVPNGFAISGQAAEGADSIGNAGTIVGSVATGSGGDALVNTGTITGSVDLGTGDDSYTAGPGGIASLGVEGGAGNDTLTGGDAADLLSGGGDSDRVRGGDGDDTLDGSLGNDTLVGGDGSDSIVGGDGIDVITGGDGDDTVEGGIGADNIRGGAGADNLAGGNDADYLAGGADDDTVTGGGGADQMFGNGGDDVLQGGTEADTISGNAGEDVIFGEDGSDVLNGGTSDDLLDGGNGDDTLRAGSGDDTLNGGAGLDLMVGGAGNDGLNGGTENDRLEGGAGDDTLTGGAGNDTFVFAPGTGRDVITDYVDGADKIDLGAYDFTGFADMLTEATLSSVAGGVRIDFDTGDSVTITGAVLVNLTAPDFVF